MKKIILNFKFLVLGVILCFGLLGSGRSFAQTTSTTPPLNFKLEAVDAISHGAITATTKQVVFLLKVTNNSPYLLNGVTLNTGNIMLQNFPATNTNIDVDSGPFWTNCGSPLPTSCSGTNSQYGVQINPFASQIFYLSSHNLILRNTSAAVIINAYMTVSVKISSTMTSSQQMVNNLSVVIPTNVAETIYEPNRT